MDASSLRVAETAAIHVKSAAGEPLYDGENAVRIILHSPGTRPYAVVESRQTARSLKRMNDNDGKVTAPTAEERVAQQAEDLAELTVRFEYLSYGDKTGRDLFEAVYADPALGFIAKQVAKALVDWGNFTPGSVGS